ncbi:MAG TPA: single-stranded DNA-binding protein, partial [Dehalococcoidales bacterium]
MQKVITDDLNALLEVFPPSIHEPLCQQTDISELIEVVMDLGRPPEARFPEREIVLTPKEATEEDIEYITAR